MGCRIDRGAEFAEKRAAMKKTLFVLALLWGATGWAAEAAPLLFKAMLVMGQEKMFSLATDGGTSSQWVRVGGEFEGYTVLRYVEAESTLVLGRDGQEMKLRLATAKIGDAAPTKATLADAEDVLRKMNFEKMMSRIMDQQKQSVIAMTRQMGGRGMPGVSSDEMAGFQKKALDVIWAEMKPETMAADMAKVYSEVFTKDELRGLGEFYDTPIGQALTDKQPVVQQKMQEIMMPRMMAAMPKIQQMGKEFAQQMAEKRKAQAAAEGAAPAPVTPATPTAPTPSPKN